MEQPLEAIIFDFGGVIFDIDYVATEKAFSKLFRPEFLPLYTKAYQKPLFDDFETGRISCEHFFHVLKSWALPGVSIQEIAHGWNAMLIGTHAERLSFLQQVGKRFRIFLLSNTNAEHKATFDLLLRQHLENRTFDSLFESAYYSHILGRRKPDRDTFTTLLFRHKLKPEKTLFIDDSIQHIESARRLGIKTHHLNGELLSDKTLMAQIDL